jgi:hypothetical protein
VKNSKSQYLISKSQRLSNRFDIYFGIWDFGFWDLPMPGGDARVRGEGYSGIG